MHHFILYGLGTDDRISLREMFVAADICEAKVTARQRTAHFDKVEVWDGPVCVFRESHGGHPDPAPPVQQAC